MIHPNERPDISTEELVRLFMGGMTTRELAHQFNCSTKLIHRRLREDSEKLLNLTWAQKLALRFERHRRHSQPEEFHNPIVLPGSTPRRKSAAK